VQKAIVTYYCTCYSDVVIKLNLERLLKARGNSYYWLAISARVNPSVISRMKHHRTKAITLDVLDRICAALECAPGDVLIRIAEKPKRVTKKGGGKKGKGS
jgi:putative transcriptional regulator